MSDPAAPDSPSALPEGHRVGDFRILRELGRGGMGVVYLAEQVSLGREVALKVLPVHLTIGAKQVQRFEREAEMVAKLSHPNIVPIYTVDRDGDTHFFAMEYVKAPTLARRIEELRREHEHSGSSAIKSTLGVAGARSWAEEVARIVRDIADALEHAHSHGIIHRDVKPQNLLLEEDGTPRILDFGLAKEVGTESVSVQGDITGTYRYMSPEQALAKRVKIDHRTDVFSLGVVLYEMLALRHPFQGGTSQQVLYAISFTEPRPARKVNPRIPRDLETICHTALEKNPGRRYDTAGEMAADLSRFLSFEPIRARPAGLLLRTSKWARRNPWPVSALVAAVIVVVAGVGLRIKAGADAREARREDARVEITAGDRARDDHAELGARIASLVGEIERERGDLEGHESGEVKLPIWEKEETVRALRAERDRRRDEAVRRYQGALAILGDDSEASARLVSFYLDRYFEARASGDPAGMRVHRESVERFDRTGDALASIEAPGRFSLDTRPTGADVYMFRYVSRYRRMWPRPFDLTTSEISSPPSADDAATIALTPTLHVSPPVSESLPCTEANHVGARRSAIEPSPRARTFCSSGARGTRTSGIRCW